MRHSLYKYFSDLKWANAFLDGEILFRSLSYFRDYEDQNIRGDQKEGIAVFRPQTGLIVTNQTQGTTFTPSRLRFRVSREPRGDLCVLRKQIAI
jgi:hypothetical protein